MARLDQLLDTPMSSDQWTKAQQAVYEEAAETLKRRGPDLLAEATPYLWSYYQSTRAEDPTSTPTIPDNADIWDHVTLTRGPDFAVGGGPLEPGRSYLSFEGEVTWDPEHGLQLVFEHGERVCKVGPFDGHFTNASAFADAALLGVVFLP